MRVRSLLAVILLAAPLLACAHSRPCPECAALLEELEAIDAVDLGPEELVPKDPNRLICIVPIVRPPKHFIVQMMHHANGT